MFAWQLQASPADHVGSCQNCGKQRGAVPAPVWWVDCGFLLWQSSILHPPSSKLKEEHMRLPDKVGIITGAGSGIGKATALAYV